MDLKKFYFNNIKDDEYHYKFNDFIKNINNQYDELIGYNEIEDCAFDIFDDDEAIGKFKELCQPNVGFGNPDNVCWFYLVTYYLYKRGYVIKEFPRILARPNINPSNFTYNEIRSKILSNGGGFNGTVPFRERRALINDLTFQQKNPSLGLDDSIEKLFVAISNRQAFFNDMSTDEKLASISNLIENMLKVDGKFIKLDYSKICFDYISDDDIKRYRKKLNCFRHGSNESINERKAYSDEQKMFLIDYGIIIVKTIRYLTKQ
ncbi:hypothetical protein HW41_05025 [Apilactobacillus kunkeei]|uniref:hypothetical protein n=1 Tax=Apilactobacillus kunkeei TaxID=148814 RepID=UPI00059B153C|nr:hypothetical protein [Apilactobacillus kunkeei]KIM18359.1 hypothetical protein HW41_05025 [Apilactobacillus kunkeei]